MRDTHLDGVDETIVRKFESAWAEGQPPTIEECLPHENAPGYRDTLEELVHIDLEFGYKSAAASSDGTEGTDTTVRRPAPVERYLDRFPVLREPEVLLRLVQQEYCLRRRYAEPPNPDEYLKRFPEVIHRGSEVERLWESYGPTVPLKETSLAHSTLDRYSVLEVQGRGGFGSVWKADDTKLGRRIAVKRLHDPIAKEPQHRSRFINEARIAARLEHPGVVPVYDLGGLEDEHPYYTMKLVGGQTLAEAIEEFHLSASADEGRRVAQLRLLNSFLSVVRTVEYAHAQGVIHRDLKPQNVILGKYGESIILDWGLAKELRAQEGRSQSVAVIPAGDSPIVTQPGTIQGTPAFMSPEQAAGDVDEVDERSDIYSLGTMLYQLLTGRLPFADSGREIFEHILNREPPRPRTIDPSVARPLEAICLQAMTKSPDRRYPTAAEFRRDLEHYLADEPVSAYNEPLRSRVSRSMRRHRTVVTGGVAAVVVAAVSLAVSTTLLTSAYQAQRGATELAGQRQAEAESNFQTALGSVDAFLVHVTEEPRLRNAAFEPLRKDLLKTALPFYEELAAGKADRPELIRRKSHALEQLSRITAELGEQNRAVDQSKQAAELLQGMIDRNEHTWGDILQLGQILNQLAVLHRDLEQVEAAEETFGEAMQFLRALSADDGESTVKSIPAPSGRPASHVQQDATTALLAALNNVAIMHENTGLHARAEAEYKEVRQKAEQLVSDNPDDLTHLEYLASIYINLSYFFNRTSQDPQPKDRTIQAAEKADHTAAELVAKLPNDHNKELLATARNNLAMFQRGRGMLSEAETNYQAALEPQRDLAKRHPNVAEHWHKLATTLGNLSTVYQLQQRPDESARAIEESLRLRESPPLSESPLPYYRYAQAGDRLTLANHLLSKLDVDAAREQLRQTREVAGRLADEFEQTEFRILWAKAVFMLSNIAAYEEDYKGAVALASTAIEKLEELRTQISAEAQVSSLLANLLMVRAEWLALDGDIDASNEDWRRAEEIALPFLAGTLIQRRLIAQSRHDHEAAAKEAGELGEVALDAGDVSQVFTAASVLAQCYVAVADDDRLPLLQRQAQADQYAENTVKLLRELQNRKLIDIRTLVANLGMIENLESLQESAAFQEWLEELQSSPPSDDNPPQEDRNPPVQSDTDAS